MKETAAHKAARHARFDCLELLIASGAALDGEYCAMWRGVVWCVLLRCVVLRARLRLGPRLYDSARFTLCVRVSTFALQLHMRAHALLS